MGKHIVLFGEECASKKEIICEKIGFLLFGITKKFNAMSVSPKLTPPSNP